MGDDALARLGPRITVAIAAGTDRWESVALETVASSPSRLSLVKRCLDLSDLLAVVATGTLRVVLLSATLDGLDTDSVERLRRAGVRSAVVVPTGSSDAERQRLRRLGVTRQVDEADLARLVALLEETASAELAPPGLADLLPPSDSRNGATGPTGPPGAGAPTGAWTGAKVDVEGSVGVGASLGRGRVVAVWGPHGAPGRTTVAIGIAAEAAALGVATTVVDADPHGGAVGQHLAVLDEASGLLAAVRLANAGQLDAGRLVTVARQLHDRLRLVTGLPRPDRWTEVRPQTLTTVLDVAATVTPLVVVDAGFGLDTRVTEGRPAPPSRDRLSMAVLEHADDVVVVASSDPVGLTRLARALLDLRGVRPQGPDLVVVNRMRDGLGWAERDVVDMVARVAPDARVAFLPDDRSAADRALVGGRTLRESGDGALRRALAGMTADHLVRVGLRPREDSRRARRRRRGRRDPPQTVSNR